CILVLVVFVFFFFFSSRRRHTRSYGDWSSDVCSSDLGDSDNDGVLVDGRNPASDRPFAGVRVNLVGSAFLHTLGIPLRQGRDIQDSDTSSSPKVAIVNQTFVDRYLHGVEAVGHHMAVEGAPKTEYTIVGVAGNSRYTQVREADRPMAYLPFAQRQGVRGL